MSVNKTMMLKLEHEAPPKGRHKTMPYISGGRTLANHNWKDVKAKVHGFNIAQIKKDMARRRQSRAENKEKTA